MNFDGVSFASVLIMDYVFGIISKTSLPALRPGRCFSHAAHCTFHCFVRVHSARGHPVVMSSFVIKIFFALVKRLSIFVKNQFIINIRISELRILSIDLDVFC